MGEGIDQTRMGNVGFEVTELLGAHYTILFTLL